MLQSNSRENQDLVVLAILNKKRNGTYLEVGAAAPIEYNNTYLLESEFGWRGVSIEWSKELADQHSVHRKNPCVNADATALDYDALLTEHNLGTHIDFLQLDIDPPDNTFKVLQLIDFKKYTFSFITYEHDYYAGGAKEREESRKIFESHGYTRLLSNVMHSGLNFEDWYVNLKYMPNDVWQQFYGDSVNMDTPNLSQRHREIFASL